MPEIFGVTLCVWVTLEMLLRLYVEPDAALGVQQL
jgi:hypothetical protein